MGKREFKLNAKPVARERPQSTRSGRTKYTELILTFLPNPGMCPNTSALLRRDPGSKA